MTLDEFLDDYVPRVLKPMGGWMVTGFVGTPSQVTPGLIRRYSGVAPRCPLTAEAGCHPEHFAEEANRLGLTAREAQTITGAADGPCDEKEMAVRARLLAGLGLSEPRP